MRYKSIVQTDPNFVRVEKPKDVEDLMQRSGVNFQVRICRVFLADVNGVPSTQISAPKVVICDFNGVPICSSKGPLILRRKDKITDAHPFEYFETNGFFAQDEPDPLPVVFNQVPGTTYQLAEYYKCKNGSIRATVAFDASGQPFFLAYVRSGYTVIQNILLAEDAFAFMESTDPFLQSSRSVDIYAGGREHFFGIDLAAGVDLSVDNAKMPDLAHTIFLFHTHDKRLAYNHIWYVRDLNLNNQPIIHMHKISIKHTKNIKERATRITDTLTAIKGEYRHLYDDSEKLKVVEVASLLEATKFLSLVRFVVKSKKDQDEDSNKIEDWLVIKIAKHFIEVVAPRRGFNLWSLYLSLCDIDGGYWDERKSPEGLPKIIESKEAFKKRESSRRDWVNLVDTEKL